MVLEAAAFKAGYRRKGWTGRLLSARWEKSEAWVSKIGSDAERGAHWDDAVAGLPSAALARKEPRLPPGEFKAIYRNKGWTGRLLAERWGKSSTWISKVSGDPERGPQWDDAVRGLPVLKIKKASRKGEP